MHKLGIFSYFKNKLAFAHTISIKHCHYSLCVCADWINILFFFFLRETPTSPWAQIRAKFLPIQPLACTLGVCLCTCALYMYLRL